MPPARSIPRKKSPAQLNREIAEILRRKPNTPQQRRAHSTKAVMRIGAKTPPKAKTNGSKKQTQIVDRANLAALAGQFDNAEKILSKSKQRTIATSYSTITPESAEEGDFADRGWVDQDGDPIEISSDDIEEEASGSRSPVTDAIVEHALQWLRDHGAAEASSTSYHAGVWYSSPYEVEDYSTGEERSEDFFLRNFTPQEEKLIFDGFKRGGRR